MISSTHITTGAALGLALGSAIPNPALAVPAAFLAGVVLHHLLDMVIHTDPGSFRAADDMRPTTASEVIFALPDNLIATALVLVIFFTHQTSWPMLFGAIGSNLPDVWHNVGYWSSTTRRIWPAYFRLHEFRHATARGKLIPLGIAANVVLITYAVYYLYTR